LAAAAVAVFGLYFLDQGYRSWIEEPTNRYETRLAAVSAELQDANREQVAGRRLANRLEEYAARALPYEADLARSRYQEWLLQLVEKHQFQSAAVDAELPRPVEIRGRRDRRKRRLIGHRIGYTLRGRTTLQRLTDFLYDFQQSAQLHKIRSFSLTPLVDGSQLDVTMDIETLTLEATERSGQLSNLVRDESSMPPRDSFTEFVRRNLFARGFSRSLAEIRLNAITRNRAGEVEAWFAVGSPPRTQRVNAGENLRIPLHRVDVVGFVEDAVQLEVNGLACTIALGETLADVFDMATPVGEGAGGGVSSPSDRAPEATETPGETSAPADASGDGSSAEAAEAPAAISKASGLPREAGVLWHVGDA
jgi:hypothetical protein